MHPRPQELTGKAASPWEVNPGVVDQRSGGIRLRMYTCHAGVSYIHEKGREGMNYIDFDRDTFLSYKELVAIHCSTYDECHAVLQAMNALDVRDEDNEDILWLGDWFESDNAGYGIWYIFAPTNRLYINWEDSAPNTIMSVEAENLFTVPREDGDVEISETSGCSGFFDM